MLTSPGVAPYAGGLSTTWLDRDLGIGGKVLVKGPSGKVTTELVQLPWPIAKVPTLAPHFGAPSYGPFNPETQLVPIIGLDNSDLSSASDDQPFTTARLGGVGSFTSTQPQRLVKAIAGELKITECKSTFLYAPKNILISV
jgi:aminopeptidase I